jgi:hypothetical protein
MQFYKSDTGVSDLNPAETAASDFFIVATVYGGAEVAENKLNLLFKIFLKILLYFTFYKPPCSFNYLAFTKLCRNFVPHLKQIKYVISRDNLYPLQS